MIATSASPPPHETSDPDDVYDSVYNPIICSPYERPSHHWQLDERGRATDTKLDGRRPSSLLVSSVPDAKTKPGDDDTTNTRINELRDLVGAWRATGYAGATPVTRSLLEYWTHPDRSPRHDGESFFGREIHFPQPHSPWSNALMLHIRQILGKDLDSTRWKTFESLKSHPFASSTGNIAVKIITRAGNEMLLRGSLSSLLAQTHKLRCK